MCRLFGFRSDVVSPVHHSLVTEQNSLRVQSVEHKDGWGIAYYNRAELPEVAHGLGPAHRDPDFERVSGLLASHAVIAHVRLASVGPVTLQNAHPFLFERWAFAHNGTIHDFARHQAQFEALIAPHFRPLIKGDTDTERCFYLFLTGLEKLEALHTPDIRRVATALARTYQTIGRMTDAPEIGKRSAMNFLVSDGRLMLCTRRDRTLFFSEWKKRSSHPAVDPPTPGTRLIQLVLASEELSGQDHWHPVEQETMVGVDEEMRFVQYRMWDTSF